MKPWMMLLAFAVGCGGSTAPRPTEPAGSGSAAPPPLELTFQTVAGEGAASRGVRIGSTLHSGDRIALEMNLNRPAYVYVVQFFADGSASVLFPEAGEERPISGAQRIPGTGWFELDDAVGDENVYVVASVAPLAEADAAIQQVVDDVRTSSTAPAPRADPPPAPVDAGVPPPAPDAAPPDAAPPPPTGTDHPRNHGAGGPPAPPPPPRGASVRSRGLLRVGATPEVHATADEMGVAVFRFWFKHAAR